MRLKAIELYKATLKLTSLQREVLVGLLLGDGHLEKSPCTECARLKVEQREGAWEYVEWLYKIFQDWIRAPLKHRKTFLKVTGKHYGKYCFTTYMHKEFLPYRKLFYVHGKKVIPKNIADLLTPLGFAVWFMDDGSIKSHESRGRIINTHAFTLKEIDLLCEVLCEKFHLQVKPRRQADGIQLYISGTSADVLQKLLETHVVPMMRYKLPLYSR